MLLTSESQYKYAAVRFFDKSEKAIILFNEFDKWMVQITSRRFSYYFYSQENWITGTSITCIGTHVILCFWRHNDDEFLTFTFHGNIWHNLCFSKANTVTNFRHNVVKFINLFKSVSDMCNAFSTIYVIPVVYGIYFHVTQQITLHYSDLTYTGKFHMHTLSVKSCL